MAFPEVSETWRMLGWLLTESGRFGEAIHAFKRAGKIKISELVDKKGIYKPIKETELAPKPSYFILGSLKAGTTSLSGWMTEHPKILPCIDKELAFWDKYKEAGLDWYQSLFLSVPAGSELIFGDATPATILYPGTIGPELYATYPDLKLIILIRNSVDRAFSHYQMAVRNIFTEQSWDEVVQKELSSFLTAPLDFDDIQDKPYQYLVGSCLYPFIKEWLEI
ncbi:MAG: hypothetical protein AAGD96_03825, partial [Chloroflexota bacterium]